MTHAYVREALLSLLLEEQNCSGFVSRDFMEGVSKKLEMSLGEVYGVASFYSFLTTKPLGKNVIRVCKSVPCYFKHSEMIVKCLEAELRIHAGETTSDGRFTLELTNCIGACDRAPAMLINDDVYGDLTPERIRAILRSYE